VVAGATLLLSLDSGLDSTPAIGELQAGLAALWPLLIASALLHHARYVIHVSNEVAPSPSRPSRLSPIVQQVWTEVLSLGPSRAGLASWLDPRHLRTVVSRAWKIASSLVRTTLLRRSDQVRKQRSESRSGDRRKAAMPIPTIAAPADSSAKPPHKSVAMSLQSVSRS
jgi:hypothetical protein